MTDKIKTHHTLTGTYMDHGYIRTDVSSHKFRILVRSGRAYVTLFSGTRHEEERRVMINDAGELVISAHDPYGFQPLDSDVAHIVATYGEGVFAPI